MEDGILDTVRVAVAEVLPELSKEITLALRGEGETALADQVDQLHIESVCPCGDDFCSSFYTGPFPNGPWGNDHRTIPLPTEQGMVNLDVVEGVIRYVEVLYRPEVKSALSGHPPAVEST